MKAQGAQCEACRKYLAMKKFLEGKKAFYIGVFLTFLVKRSTKSR